MLRHWARSSFDSFFMGYILHGMMTAVSFWPKSFSASILWGAPASL